MMQMDNSGTSRFWYHGWNVVAVCILSQVAANGLTYNALSLFLPGWSKEMHTPVSKLQLTVAAMALVSAFLSPIVGALADKYPARRLLVTGLIGMALFYTAVSLTTEAWQVIALYAFLVPLALCLSTAVVANALISRWFVRRIGLALGLSAFGIGMAGVILPPLIASLLPSVGWRMIWRGGALVLVIAVMPLVAWVARNRPTEAEGKYYLSSDGSAAKHHGHGSAASSQLSFRDVVSRRNFWLLVAIYLPMLALYGGLGQNLAPFAANHGLSQQSAGILISVLSLFHVVSTLVLGLLSDRFGNRLPFAGLALVMVAGAGIVTVSSGLVPLAVGTALIGFGGGLFTLLAAAIAIEFGAEGVGRAFGLCMMFIPLNALAPYAVAKAQENTGSYSPALLGLAALVLVAGFLSLLLRERRGGSQLPDVPLQAAAPENNP